MNKELWHFTVQTTQLWYLQLHLLYFKSFVNLQCNLSAFAMIEFLVCSSCDRQQSLTLYLPTQLKCCFWFKVFTFTVFHQSPFTSFFQKNKFIQEVYSGLYLIRIYIVIIQRRQKNKNNIIHRIKTSREKKQYSSLSLLVQGRKPTVYQITVVCEITVSTGGIDQHISNFLRLLILLQRKYCEPLYH